MVQGTAGAFAKTKYIKPTPEWSAKTAKSYGYGRITIRGGHLKYQYRTIPGGHVQDEWNIIKDLNQR